MKKGEKSLQMIFGLFLLLIISLVVLSMFFKFVKKGTSETSTAAESYIKQAAKEQAISECENLCREASDDNSKIEFCSTAFAVDWDKDGTIEGKAEHGAWYFCEEKIPCFVLSPNCKNRYDGNYCRDLLASLAPKKYYGLWLNSDGTEITFAGGLNDDVVLSDGCGLPHHGTVADPTLNIFPTDYNWKERFCFYMPYDAVNSDAFTDANYDVYNDHLALPAPNNVDNPALCDPFPIK